MEKQCSLFPQTLILQLFSGSFYKEKKKNPGLHKGHPQGLAFRLPGRHPTQTLEVPQLTPRAMTAMVFKCFWLTKLYFLKG